MSQNHEPVPAPEQRQPSLMSMNIMLNQQLDAKAQEIRNLEANQVARAAFINDLMGENSAMQAAMDQISAENRLLRKRLGLDELGALELTDEEANDFEEAPVEVGVEE